MIPAYLRWYWDCQKVTFSVLTQRQKWYMKKQAKRSSITCWWRFWVWHYRSPTVIRNCLRWTLPIGSFAYMSFKWATLVLLHSYYRLHKQNGNSSWNVFPAIFLHVYSSHLSFPAWMQAIIIGHAICTVIEIGIEQCWKMRHFGLIFKHYESFCAMLLKFSHGSISKVEG